MILVIELVVTFLIFGVVYMATYGVGVSTYFLLKVVRKMIAVLRCVEGELEWDLKRILEEQGR